jgi:phosphoribosylanthranilate isomerase
MVKVKICGVTTREDAFLAVEAGADAIGLNFFDRSPRYLAMESAESIVAGLPDSVCRVGVFVDARRQDVERIVERLGLQAVQLHGDESEDYCLDWDCKVIKAVRAKDRETVRRIGAYPVDFVLVDAYVKGLAGGTGQLARWEWLSEIARDRLIVAGGLTPDNVADAVRQLRPAVVDVASGVESAPGKKDPERVRSFVVNAKSA